MTSSNAGSGRWCQISPGGAIRGDIRRALSDPEWGDRSERMGERDAGRNGSEEGRSGDQRGQVQKAQHQGNQPDPAENVGHGFPLDTQESVAEFTGHFGHLFLLLLLRLCSHIRTNL